MEETKKRQIIDLMEAILKRYAWLREHDAEIRDAHLQRLNSSICFALFTQ